MYIIIKLDITLEIEKFNDIFAILAKKGKGSQQATFKHLNVFEHILTIVIGFNQKVKTIP